MNEITKFLSENATWLFGGGGAAAFVLAVLKILLARGKSAPSAGNTTTTTTIKTGAGPIEYGLGLAVVIAAVGGLMFITGPKSSNSPTAITATDGSAVTQGDNNETIINKNTNE